MDFEKFKREREERERKRKERERQKKERERKKEQERLKKERKKAKKEANREKRQKLLKSRQNHRAYMIRKRKLEKERRKNGERKSYFSIYIVRNNIRVKQLGWSLLMSKAYEIYNNAIEENKKVMFPLQWIKPNKRKCKFETEVKYEILLTEKVEEVTSNPQFRDENGKFTEHVISDMENRIILEKNEWNVEESFHVYGYNPVRHRKDYTFIKNEIILKKFTNSFDIARIMVWKNKLFIMSSDDFDLVVCKNKKDTIRLSDALEKDLTTMKFKNALFMGVVRSAFIANDLIEKLQEKTGWSKAFCCSGY